MYKTPVFRLGSIFVLYLGHHESCTISTERLLYHAAITMVLFAAFSIPFSRLWVRSHSLLANTSPGMWLSDSQSPLDCSGRKYYINKRQGQLNSLVKPASAVGDPSTFGVIVSIYDPHLAAEAKNVPNNFDVLIKSGPSFDCIRSDQYILP